MSVRTTKKHKWTVSLPYTILGMIALAMILTGCLHEETKLNQNRLQVEQETFRDTVPVARLNDAAIDGLARHYSKHGDGPLELAVTYDPKSRSSGAMQASDEAARIVRDLRAVGVRDVDVSILPVNGSGGQMNAMISYTAYHALAPKDCSMIAGYNDLKVEAEEDYKLGCTTETLFAQQIARPKDLKGKAGAYETSDGRRSANILEGYRAGVPNEALEGQSATEE